MKLTRTTTIATALAALGLSACGGDDGERASTAGPAADAKSQVSVKTFMFTPDPIEVERGSRVTWVNEDETVHTVTTGPRDKPDGRLDGQLKASGGKFSATFDRAGTYRYFCSRHSGPGMEAEVVVR